jgi:prolyl oligopeptidase
MKNNLTIKLFASFFLSLFIVANATAQAADDSYLWLEDIEGKKALEFVEQNNKTTFEALSKEPLYQKVYSRTLEILNSKDRIANPVTHGDFVYNFWKDKDHERGIWRRTTKSSYLSANPVWEILLDIDELSKKDGVKWVYKGESGLYPKYNRFLISLSKGGGDAVVTREFDVTTKSFVENGFYIPEGKGRSLYLDENTLVVCSDFGPGTMTTSGYPRQVKLWKRGIALKEATLIFEGERTDVECVSKILRDGKWVYLTVNQNLTFYTTSYFVWQNNQKIKLDIPGDIELNVLLHNQLVLSLKSDWTVNGKTYKKGTVVSADFSKLLKGEKDIHVIFEPDTFSSVTSVSNTKNKLLLNILNNVKSELSIYAYDNNSWNKTKVEAPDYGTINTGATDEFTDQYFFSFQNFLIPPSLFTADAEKNTIVKVRSLPAFFDASRYTVSQYKAKSKDGTEVPYFVVSSKTMVPDGKNPTLLYAYGGFEISEQPRYSGTIGNAWLDNDGVYVLANLRGGGEFGPQWHQDAILEKRQNCYDDFYAVAEDLIARKITSTRHLGIEGGSNGGLLVGVAFTQRPDLYNAVLCEVPLLDMKRYNKLLAGASWMAEFGNPDKPEDWAYIQKYSPFQNLKQGINYPEVFFYTSTRDDRVHPGHARKMAAKMTDMGYKIYYFENTEGGHAEGSTNEQTARLSALKYTYLWLKLK